MKPGRDRTVADISLGRKITRFHFSCLPIKFFIVKEFGEGLETEARPTQDLQLP